MSAPPPTFPAIQDYYNQKAQDILDGKPKAERPAPRPYVPPEPTKRFGVKKAIRRALRQEGGYVWGANVDEHTDSINRLTNVVFKRVVRPLLAQVFADGVEAGREDLASCCGCSGGDVTNPYDGSVL